MARKTGLLRASMTWRAAGALLLAAAWCGSIAASQAAIDSSHHPWSRFAKGTSIEIRMITETLDAEGQVATTSTTRRTTTLVSRAEGRVTLRVVAMVTVGGRRFEADPQVLELGLYDEPIDDTFQLVDDSGESSSVTIEGVPYPCRIVAFTQMRQGTELTTRLFYSPEVEPHVLRLETKPTEAASEPTPGERTMEVLALRVPYPWESRIFPAALRRDARTHAGGTTITLSWFSTSIPGGVFAASSREFNRDGRVVRRSWIELVKAVIVK